MKAVKAFGYIIFTALLVLTAQVGHSHEEQLNEAEIIRSKFPDITIDHIQATPVPGVFELTVNDQVVYYAPESGITFFGEMWDQNKKNLTAVRTNALQAAKIADLPLDKAIRIGNGPNTVIEVVDPDCPFCRKTHAFFNKRNDLTRYIFLFPITQIHPDAEKKALYILCANDRNKAYEEALSGGLDRTMLAECKEEKAVTLLLAHQEIGRKLNVRGTPALWINGQFVPGADFRKIQEILDGHS